MSWLGACFGDAGTDSDAAASTITEVTTNRPPEITQKAEAKELGPAQVFTDAGTVGQVQIALKALGYDPGTVDGKWGPNTASALGKWRADRGDDSTPKGQPPTADDLHGLNVSNDAIVLPPITLTAPKPPPAPSAPPAPPPPAIVQQQHQGGQEGGNVEGGGTPHRKKSGGIGAGLALGAAAALLLGGGKMFRRWRRR